jgi:hypothetical protein
MRLRRICPVSGRSEDLARVPRHLFLAAVSALALSGVLGLAATAYVAKGVSI